MDIHDDRRQNHVLILSSQSLRRWLNTEHTGEWWLSTEHASCVRESIIKDLFCSAHVFCECPYYQGSSLLLPKTKIVFAITVLEQVLVILFYLTWVVCAEL